MKNNKGKVIFVRYGDLLDAVEEAAQGSAVRTRELCERIFGRDGARVPLAKARRYAFASCLPLIAAGIGGEARCECCGVRMIVVGEAGEKPGEEGA